MRWEQLSRAERDAAYNNVAAVPNSAALKTMRESASSALREEHCSALDIPYGAGARQKWDLFASRRPGAPCLVFIHGGYWQMNGRENFASIVQGALVHGWAAALPGYTLAPHATLGDIAGEIDCALDWLQSHAPAHGIEGPIILSGWSAGGHLAALSLGHPVVKAGLAISGIFDLARLRDTYVNDKLRLTDDQIKLLSPLRLPVVEKPMLIAYGTAELPALIDESVAFHAYRAEHRAPGALMPIAGGDHFTILDSLSSPDGAVIRSLLDMATAL